MLMALVVLVGFGLLFMFAFDEGFQGGGVTIEAEIASQAKEIESFKSTIDNGKTMLALAPSRVAAAKELTGLKRSNLAQVEKIAGLKTEIETGNSGIVAKQQEWETYKDKYRELVRGKAKGQLIEKLETRSGVVYMNANIREVTAVGIQIRHDEGQKRIAFEELPDELQDFYQFDPEQKQKAVAAETAARDQHDAAVAVAGDQADAQMAIQRQKEQAEAKDKLKRDIIEKQAQIENVSNDIKDLEQERDRALAAADAARAAGKMHINKSGSIGSKIRAKQNRLATLRSELAQMKARL